ncbi:MAG: hypothetical protein HN336_10295 [Lentimicrobiaceae bacterium]|jgi:hypothetical protein|nr:hypothetical protein [Lentimicrobiaceae bacterium]
MRKYNDPELGESAMDKIILPELSEKSGLSRKYLIALGSVMNYIEAVEEEAPSRVRYMTKRTFMHRVVLYYDIYFNEDKYIDVVTESTSDAVLKINSYVDKINALRESEQLDHEELRNMVDEIVRIIN